MASLDPLARTAVRLIATANSNSFFGSGVVLTAATILTARHVVDPDGVSLVGRHPDPRSVRIQGVAFGAATLTVDVLRFPSDPAIDLALAILQPPKAADATCCCVLPAESGPVVNVGDEVAFYGSSRIDGPIERDDLRVQSVHGNAGSFVCNKAAPRGFSGGPVFSGGLLAGITYARQDDQGQSYFYAGEALSQAVTLAVGEVTRVSGAVHILRRYPLGPAMPGGEMAARLSRFIAKCVKLHNPMASIVLVTRAIQMRMECGPDSGDKGLIQLEFLPDPSMNRYGFWFDAFVMATSKSPRMLAALLLAIDDEPFTSEERAEKADVLDRLEHIGH
jgi:hypothetical protein